MTNFPISKQYDLEDRTYQFAKDYRDFVGSLPKTLTNVEYLKQLARSSNSPAANYIEANESVSKKDFLHRIKIYRKESTPWLKLCQFSANTNLSNTQKKLIQEAIKLTKIFSSIVKKSR